MTLSNNQLAIERTKLANQRTYLAYMRTGFGIATVAGTFKKTWIVLFGVLMIIGSTLQYIIINTNLKNKKIVNSDLLNLLPIIYTILSLGVLILQFNLKKN